MMSPLSNVDIDQHDHVDLLDSIKNGYANSVHAMGKRGPDSANRFNCPAARRDLATAEASTNLEAHIANRW